jgi:hypothetical protein
MKTTIINYVITFILLTNCLAVRAQENKTPDKYKQSEKAKVIEVNSSQYKVILENIANGASDIMIGTGLVYGGSAAYALTVAGIPAYILYIPLSVGTGIMSVSATSLAVMVGGVYTFGHGTGMFLSGASKVLTGTSGVEFLTDLMVYLDENNEDLWTTKVGHKIGSALYDLVNAE